METINPHVTIQNVAGPNWLVSFAFGYANGELLNITTAVPKSTDSVQMVHIAAMQRAIDILQKVIQNTAEGEKALDRNR